jgi:signal transduction histidine kinase
MRREVVSLRDCVASALEALAVGLKETGATIETGQLPQVGGDRTMLTQLFQNLLSNALKFTGSNHPAIGIQARRDGGFWIVDVTDNGLGIRPEYMEKIFQPFRRVHVKPGQEGTGIGLAICRKVVERHGGQIWAESEPGHGAKFVFTLPVGDEQQQ